MLQADWVSVLEQRRLSPRLAAEEVAYKPGSHIGALERRRCAAPSIRTARAPSMPLTSRSAIA